MNNNSLRYVKNKEINIRNKIQTYFLPRDIIPYSTPVPKTRPQPKRLPSPGQNNIGGIAILWETPTIVIIILIN